MAVSITKISEAKVVSPNYQGHTVIIKELRSTKLEEYYRPEHFVELIIPNEHMDLLQSNESFDIMADIETCYEDGKKTEQALLIHDARIYQYMVGESTGLASCYTKGWDFGDIIEQNNEGYAKAYLYKGDGL